MSFAVIRCGVDAGVLTEWSVANLARGVHGVITGDAYRVAEVSL
jgi:hypothetical protein